MSHLTQHLRSHHATSPIEWEYSSAVKRDSAWMQQLAPALGSTDVQMDALFTQAPTL